MSELDSAKFVIYSDSGFTACWFANTWLTAFFFELKDQHLRFYFMPDDDGSTVYDTFN